MDSFTFELDKEVRDADRKIRAARKYSKHFKQLAHRRLKRSKDLLKRSNELGELNRELNDEAGSLIKALTSQKKTGKILFVFHLHKQLLPAYFLSLISYFYR